LKNNRKKLTSLAVYITEGAKKEKIISILQPIVHISFETNGGEKALKESI